MTEMNQYISWVHSIGKVRDFLIIMIRHKVPLLYAFLDFVNRLYGSIVFRGFKRSLLKDSWEGVRLGDTVRILTENDIQALIEIINGASEKSKELFKPHAITDKTFRQLMRAPYYLAVGYYLSGKLAGYAFLRLYFPRKAFAGYFVADKHQGKGIGKHLFNILKSIASETTFALYTYNKEENLASIHVSPDFTVEQRMPGGYLVLKHNVDKKG